jgi:hypothetical protein
MEPPLGSSVSLVMFKMFIAKVLAHTECASKERKAAGRSSITASKIEARAISFANQNF